MLHTQEGSAFFTTQKTCLERHSSWILRGSRLFRTRWSIFSLFTDFLGSDTTRPVYSDVLTHLQWCHPSFTPRWQMRVHSPTWPELKVTYKYNTCSALLRCSALMTGQFSAALDAFHTHTPPIQSLLTCPWQNPILCFSRCRWPWVSSGVIKLLSLASTAHLLPRCWSRGLLTCPHHPCPWSSDCAHPCLHEQQERGH